MGGCENARAELLGANAPNRAGAFGGSAGQAGQLWLQHCMRLSRLVPRRPSAVHVHLPGGPTMPLEFGVCFRLAWWRGYFGHQRVACSLHGKGCPELRQYIYSTAQMTSCWLCRPCLREKNLGVHVGASVHGQRPVCKPPSKHSSGSEASNAERRGAVGFNKDFPYINAKAA